MSHKELAAAIPLLEQTGLIFGPGWEGFWQAGKSARYTL